MLSQRVQAAMVALFLLLIAGVVYVLLSRFEPGAPPPSSAAASEDALGPAERGPVGSVSLTAGTGDLVTRVTAGSCREPGGPKLELSKNQSRTFRRVSLPQIDDGSGISAASPAVQAIAWARATSPVKIRVIAADTECVAHEYLTTDGGATWTREPGGVEKWFKDPNTEGVAAPSGPVDSGCTGVVSVMPITKKSAKVFCADGAIRATIDGGATWTDVGALPGTSVAIFTSAQTGYAAVSMPKCKSRIHVTVNGGLTWTPRGCVHEQFVLPGLTGSDALLVAGGTAGMRISKNGGATWKPPTKK